MPSALTWFLQRTSASPVEINLATIDLGLFHCQARTEDAHFYHDNCKQTPLPVRLVGPMWNQRGRGRILRIRICWSEEGWTSDDESQHGPQDRTQGVLRPPLEFRHPAAVRLARGSSDHRNSDGHHRDISGGARGKIIDDINHFGKLRSKQFCQQLTSSFRHRARGKPQIIFALFHNVNQARSAAAIESAVTMAWLRGLLALIPHGGGADEGL
jgi:hypothetical protein